jgi:hypothetical protein
MNDENDKLARAYARLTAMQKAFPAERHVQVHERYVREFHAALDHLEQLGYSTAEFRVPSGEIRPREEGGNYLTGEVDYSLDNYVERDLLLMKLESVLAYFRLRTEQKRAEFGGPTRG